MALTKINSAGLNINADTASGDDAAVGYTAAEGLILTGQGSTDDVTIKNDADTTVINVATGSSDVEVSAGDLIFGTAGKGVCLGVTSNTDANTLDDYEEGTWTPTIQDGASSPTYTHQFGKYTKIGNMVMAFCSIRINAQNDGGADKKMYGFPFTNSDTGYSIPGYFGYYSSLADPKITYASYLVNNATNCYIIGQEDDSGTVDNAIDIWGDDARIDLMHIYWVTTA